jgi:hypothetical protein
MSTPDPFAAPEPSYGQPPYGQQQPAYGQPAYGQQPPPGALPPRGYGPAPAYGHPPYGDGPPHAAQRTNGMAIASMVLGILWLWWIGSVLALVFGYVAKNQIRERGDTGGGMATAGIVLGWIGIGFLSLFLLVGFAGAFGSSSSF